MQKKFELGEIVGTPAALQLLESNGKSPSEFLNRHITGDWGELDADDVEVNERALTNGGRLLSSYKVGESTVWVITEADRSVTTLLLPSDY